MFTVTVKCVQCLEAESNATPWRKADSFALDQLILLCSMCSTNKLSYNHQTKFVELPLFSITVSRQLLLSDHKLNNLIISCS